MTLVDRTPLYLVARKSRILFRSLNALEFDKNVRTGTLFRIAMVRSTIVKYKNSL